MNYAERAKRCREIAAAARTQAERSFTPEGRRRLLAQARREEKWAASYEASAQEASR